MRHCRSHRASEGVWQGHHRLHSPGTKLNRLLPILLIIVCAGQPQSQVICPVILIQKSSQEAEVIAEIQKKQDFKCRNTLGCLDRYMQSVETETAGTAKTVYSVQRIETMKESGLWSSLGTHGSLVVIWWLYISSSCETRKFDILVKFDLAGQCQLPPRTTAILTKVFCASGPNFRILAFERVMSYGADKLKIG